eukprot:symbB.v1.2.003455.t1/scaffold194.1/size275082/16
MLRGAVHKALGSLAAAFLTLQFWRRMVAEAEERLNHGASWQSCDVSMAVANHGPPDGYPFASWSWCIQSLAFSCRT